MTHVWMWTIRDYHLGDMYSNNAIDYAQFMAGRKFQASFLKLEQSVCRKNKTATRRLQTELARMNKVSARSANGLSTTSCT